MQQTKNVQSSPLVRRGLLRVIGGINVLNKSMMAALCLIFWLIMGLQVLVFIATTILTMTAACPMTRDQRQRETTMGIRTFLSAFTARLSMLGRRMGEEDHSGPQEPESAQPGETENIAYPYYDPLTTLPNRSLLFDHMELALPRAHRAGRHIAVLFIDVDDFKLVNDVHGHAAGDHLLTAIATVLQTELRASDTPARLGGDEFVALLDDVAGPNEATTVVERILRALKTPFDYNEKQIRITASIGIALSTGPEDRPADLLDRADQAMYRAKSSSSRDYQLYDQAMNEESIRRRILTQDLRGALERDELRVYYQPTVRLTTNTVIGAEALVRWKRPEHGLLSPSEFLPHAEEIGLIAPIDRWVMRQACRQARMWREQGIEDTWPLISVNLSLRHITQPSVVAAVAASLDESGLQPEWLAVEIPESAIIVEPAATEEAVAGLKHLGVAIMVDQFGAAASSLQTLHQLGVDYLKLDRSLMAMFGQNADSTALVSALITLAHNLGIRVFAHGVETEQQVTWLRELGCDLVQGYYFAKPDDQQATTRLILADPPGFDKSTSS